MVLHRGASYMMTSRTAQEAGVKIFTIHLAKPVQYTLISDKLGSPGKTCITDTVELESFELICF